MGLDEYHRKRRFDATPEPRGRLRRRRGRSFVIQKHRASRLHYDLRLEMEGVLRSWAIPKGPSLNPRDKRLALQTEDHPVDYGDFEGVIPKGNYGAGRVIIWDRGAYAMVDPETPEEGWKQRKFHFTLEGTKLQGEWVLVKAGPEDNQWLFFKVSDEFASSEAIVETRPESVLSGLGVDDIGGDLRDPPLAWHSKVERELERLGIKTRDRVPFPKGIRPMLAGSVDEPFDNEDWLFEMKLDGIRSVAYRDRDRIDLLSRNQKSLSEAFPSLEMATRR